MILLTPFIGKCKPKLKQQMKSFFLSKTVCMFWLSNKYTDLLHVCQTVFVFSPPHFFQVSQQVQCTDWLDCFDWIWVGPTRLCSRRAWLVLHQHQKCTNTSCVGAFICILWKPVMIPRVIQLPAWVKFHEANYLNWSFIKWCFTIAHYIPVWWLFMLRSALSSTYELLMNAKSYQHNT